MRLFIAILTFLTNHTPKKIFQAQAHWLSNATTPVWIGFGLVALVVAFVSILVHEYGHMVAGRAFGWNGRILAFRAYRNAPFRRKRGLLSFAVIFCVHFPEQELQRAPSWQVRIVALAGTFFQTIFLLVFVWVVLSLWERFAFAGPNAIWIETIFLASMLTTLISTTFVTLCNLVPLRRIKTDGYFFFFPDAARKRMASRT